jgi:hypothetical protein
VSVDQSRHTWATSLSCFVLPDLRKSRNFKVQEYCYFVSELMAIVNSFGFVFCSIIFDNLFVQVGEFEHILQMSDSAAILP